MIMYHVSGRAAGSVKNLPTPHHLICRVQQSEPLSPVYGKSLIERMKQRDALREDRIVMDRVVYDSISAPRMPRTRSKKNVTASSPLSSPRKGIKSGAVVAGGETPLPRNTSSHSIEYFSNSENDDFHDDSENQISADLQPYYRLKGEHDSTLVFESRFESGNLRRATQIFEFEYDLRLNFDLFTRGHTQWFYFSVRNMHQGQTYTFNIVNLLKPDSLFNYGMQPVVYSEHMARTQGIGWHRDGFDVCYYTNTSKRENGAYFRTLTWSYECKYDNDIVYFAHCYPYTYTDLQRYLHRLEHDPERNRLFKRQRLCESLAGNRVDLLTITEPTDDKEELGNRKGIVLSARIHPGESNASWMMKGALDWLLDPRNEKAKQFRSKYIAKVVPMINPDGVINGNYRCSLDACDLNRRWKEPMESEHPEVFHQKKMMREFGMERDIVMFVDFHGHSRKKNIFMYGCTNLKNRRERLEVKIFPKLVSAMAKNHFSFTDCSFNLSASKDSTARVVAFQELRILNSFTLEASFCGPSIGNKAGTHFSTLDLQRMGTLLCRAALAYDETDKRDRHYHQLEKMFPRKPKPPTSDFFPEVVVLAKEPPKADAGDTSVSIADELRAVAMAQQIEEQEAEGREQQESAQQTPLSPESPVISPIASPLEDDDEGYQNEQEQEREVEKFVMRRKKRSGLLKYPLSAVDRMRMKEAVAEESTFSIGSDSEASDHRIVKTKRKMHKKVRRVRGKPLTATPRKSSPIGREAVSSYDTHTNSDSPDSDSVVHERHKAPQKEEDQDTVEKISEETPATKDGVSNATMYLFIISLFLLILALVFNHYI